MSFCPKCGNQVPDGVTFCGNCGTSIGVAAQPAAAVDLSDHTAEFDPRDISDNKVIAMLPYLMGVIGIIVAMLAIGESRYIAFHIKQALKFTVVNVILGILAAVLCITFIVPFAAGVCMIIVFVLQVIAFFQVCGGKAKEPAIIRDLKFLK